MRELDVIAAAREVLLAELVEAEVCMRGDEIPADALPRLVLIDWVTSTPFGTGDAITVLQIGSYAPTLEESLTLAQECEDVLLASKFVRGQSRPAPQTAADDPPGVLTDYRRA